VRLTISFGNHAAHAGLVLLERSCPRQAAFAVLASIFLPWHSGTPQAHVSMRICWFPFRAVQCAFTTMETVIRPDTSYSCTKFLLAMPVNHANH